MGGAVRALAVRRAEVVRKTFRISLVGLENFFFARPSSSPGPTRPGTRARHRSRAVRRDGDGQRIPGQIRSGFPRISAARLTSWTSASARGQSELSSRFNPLGEIWCDPQPRISQEAAASYTPPMSSRTRPLDAIEVRVLGSLLEKEQTTPEVYPLTMSALLAACNQKTNRYPVTNLTETEVDAAVERLRQEAMVWRSEGARSERWQQNVGRRWGLNPARKALMTLLLLRGPQTVGELHARSDRLHPFASLAEVEETLRAMAAEDEPLVRELPRRPGQKENRWVHMVGEVAEAAPEEAPELAPTSSGAAGHVVDPRPSLAARVEALEAEVVRLAAELAELRKLWS
jgi:uncharacterized protein YceH (UPF0502 family)